MSYFKNRIFYISFITYLLSITDFFIPWYEERHVLFIPHSVSQTLYQTPLSHLFETLQYFSYVSLRKIWLKCTRHQYKQWRTYADGVWNERETLESMARGFRWTLIDWHCVGLLKKIEDIDTVKMIHNRYSITWYFYAKRGEFEGERIVHLINPHWE